MWEQENTCSRTIHLAFFSVMLHFLGLVFIWTLVLYLVCLVLLGCGGLLCGIFVSHLQVPSNKADEFISFCGLKEACALSAAPQEFSIHKLHSLNYTSI